MTPSHFSSLPLTSQWDVSLHHLAHIPPGTELQHSDLLTLCVPWWVFKSAPLSPGDRANYFGVGTHTAGGEIFHLLSEVPFAKSNV